MSCQAHRGARLTLSAASGRKLCLNFLASLSSCSTGRALAEPSRRRPPQGAAPDGYDPSSQYQPLVQPDPIQEPQLRPRKGFQPRRAFCVSVLHRRSASQARCETLEALINKAKSQPGQLNYATGGVGSATFIVAEVLKAQAGLDMVHIPYGGGGSALTSILSGVTDLYGSPYATAKPFVDEGKLLGLAVTTTKRIPYSRKCRRLPKPSRIMRRRHGTASFFRPAPRRRLGTNYKPE